MNNDTLDDPIFQQLIKIVIDLPFNQVLGLKLNAIEKNHVSLSFSMKKELIGNFLYGILHGGVISSVLDMTGGFAVMVNLVQKQEDKSIEKLTAMLGKISTTNLNINYLSPGRGEYFIATATLIHAGNKLNSTLMDLHNSDGALIATGSGTYLAG